MKSRKDEYEELRDHVKDLKVKELYQEYLNKLADKFDLRVNEKLLEKIASTWNGQKPDASDSDRSEARD